MGAFMKIFALALLVTGSIFAVAHDANAEGRRMMIFTIYGSYDSISHGSTTTVVDFTTQVACREARKALQRDNTLRTQDFRVVATCVDP